MKYWILWPLHVSKIRKKHSMLELLTTHIHIKGIACLIWWLFSLSINLKFIFSIHRLVSNINRRRLVISSPMERGSVPKFSVQLVPLCTSLKTKLWTKNTASVQKGGSYLSCMTGREAPRRTKKSALHTLTPRWSFSHNVQLWVLTHVWPAVL